VEDIAAIKSAIKKRNDDLKDRFDRMERDFERWNLDSLKKKGSFEYQISQKSRDTDIEVISNAPRTFADKVQAVLTSADRQIIVRMAEAEGEDKREDIGKLERLLEFAFEKADERLIRILQPPLMDSLVWYSIVRGWVAARILVYKDGDDVIFDLFPLDPRWLTYQTSANGLLWVAYTISKSPEELEDEYGKITKKPPWYKPWEKSAKSYDEVDYWRYEGKGKIINGIFCENEWLKEPEIHEMLSMPILINPVATRPPIRGEDTAEGYGESIYAPNRDIYDLLNKLGTMWASHANLLYKQPTINFYDESGIELKSTAYLAEAVVNLPLNHNKLEPSPMKEISPTLVNLFGEIDRWKTQGSMPDIDIGSPPPSGTLYNLIQEASNKVFNPQLRNLSTFYADICRLVEEQILTSKLKVNVKTELEKKYYETKITPVDLKKPHIIKVEFTAKTPWSQLDTYQVANMAKALGLPDGFIHEHILKLPDPKGLGDLSAIEMAEHSPKLALVRAIKALIEKGRADEAMQLVRDLYNLEMSEQMEIQNAGMEQSQAEPTPETGEAEGTLPLPA